MLRSILVGLDGSAYSTAAMELGLRWAKQSNAVLVGLGVIDEPTICKPEPVSIGGSSFKHHRDEHLLVDARHKVDQFLETFALRCAEMKVACKVVEDVGLPHEQIVIEAQRYDLIILGQQTYFHFETEEGPGDTLHKVLKHTPRPVVTVPRELGDGSSAVIAYDGSLQAARTLQAFVAVRPNCFQEVHVVSVHADNAEAARRADRAAEFLRLHEIAAHTHSLASSASAGEVILEQAGQLDAALLVMGAYGHSAVREHLFGSVTRTVLKHIAVPLFLYH